MVSDPQVRLQLRRACASARPGFWLRTMSPAVTTDAAAWYDVRMRDCLSDILAVAPMPSMSWDVATLPCRLGGLGITPAHASRNHAYYASWAASWHNMTRMFPHAITIAPHELASCPLPFAIAMRAAHRSCDSALTVLSDNTNHHPLPDVWKLIPPSLPRLTSPSVSPMRKSALLVLSVLPGGLECSIAPHLHSEEISYPWT